MTLSTYEFTVQCGAPPDVVFEVLADATHWKDWAGSTIGVSEWDREGVPAPGGVGAVRKLGRWPFFTREQITEYDPPRHLGYTILSGIPVRGYHADIDLVPRDDRHQHPMGGRVRAEGARDRHHAGGPARTDRPRLRTRRREGSRAPLPLIPARPHKAATCSRSETDRYLLRSRTRRATEGELHGRDGAVRGSQRGRDRRGERHRPRVDRGVRRRGHARADDRPRRGSAPSTRPGCATRAPRCTRSWST